MPFKDKSSLRSEFIYALFMVMVVTSIFIMLFDYYFVYTRNTESLKKEAENKMVKAVETLRQPLWFYDVKFVRNFAEILANDSSLIHVSVFDERNRELVEFDRPGGSKKENDIQWELERTVQYNDKIVGRLVMNFTNLEIRRLTGQMFLSDIVIMIAVLISVLSTTWLLLTKQIINPLGVMEATIQSISAGDYSRRLSLQKENELFIIAREFNRMVDQVELREGKLTESEMKYRNLVESSTDIIFRTNLDGNLVFMNQNFEKWTGYPVKNFIGLPFIGLFPPKFSEPSLDNFHNGLSGEKINLYEVELISRDNAIVAMELNLTIQRDMDGKPFGAMGIARDITKRRRTESELRKYEQMISSTTDYMWLIDRDFIIQAVNDAYINLSDKQRRDFIGHHVENILGKELFETQLKPHMDLCLTGNNVKHQSWIHFPESGSRCMDITFYPNFEQDRSVSGVVVNQRDITGQKQLEFRLHQAHKMESIGTLAGGIAHDFNNILGGIIGYAEMVEMFDLGENERLASRIEHILKGAYRARDLVEQILTFSRHTEQEKKNLRLGPVVRETLKFLRATIPATIEIVEDMNCASDVVLADVTHIHQVLMNLCGNAACAMEESGGTLTVSLTESSIALEDADALSDVQPGEYIRLSVADTGHGIDPAIAERIFDPFFTTNKTGTGTGMGLAVVHGIVKNLGGTITVRSQPGSGCTFNILLPRCDHEPEEIQPTLLHAAPSGKGRILFVDDEEELVSFSRDILDELGYDVVAVDCSRKAQQLFLADPYGFDLVITDQTMPNITGLDLAVEFLEKRPDIPIVLCTGFSSPDFEQQVLAAGIRLFVKKPLGARQLADIVSGVIKGA